MTNVLFVLAHQDDEYFAAPWIQNELKNGNAAFCIYLTDGGSRTEPEVRDAESRSGLASLGIPAHNVAFIGTANRIPDGRLVRHLARARDLSDEWIARRGLVIDRIYAPDFEGGHADHDAAHLVALSLAVRRAIVAGSWGFALYNGHNCRRPIFRTLRLLRRSGARCTRYSIVRGLRLAMFCWRYRSQRRTWLGLFPESFLRRLFVRAEWVNRFDVNRVFDRPHEGVLLYEWMFGASYTEFERYAREFREQVRA